MNVAAKPLADDPGHCEIAELTFSNRKAMPFADWQAMLAEQLCLRIEGPLPQDVESTIGRNVDD